MREKGGGAAEFCRWSEIYKTAFYLVYHRNLFISKEVYLSYNQIYQT